MKLPNKFLRVLLAAMMIAGLSVLAGCGSDESDNSASGNKDAKNIVVATRGTSSRIRIRMMMASSRATMSKSSRKSKNATRACISRLSRWLSMRPLLPWTLRRSI